MSTRKPRSGHRTGNEFSFSKELGSCRRRSAAQRGSSMFRVLVSRNWLLQDPRPDRDSGIYARSLTGDPTKNPEHLLVSDFQAPWGGFYPFNDGFYSVGYDPDGHPRAFRFYFFENGKSVDIAPSPLNLGMGITVTPDRTRLAFCTKSRGNEDLVQIEIR